MSPNKLLSSAQLSEARLTQAHLSRLRFDPPKRSKDGRTLSHLPNEVFAMIFEYLLSPRDCPEDEAKAVYDSLIPVCRFFRALFLPLRLRHLVIHSTAPRHVDFIRSIQDYPFPAHSLRAYIEKLTFRDWQTSPHADTGSNWVTSALLARYIPVLSSFPNLQELDLTDVTISRSFFDTVAYLGKLERVSISTCDFSEFEDAEDPYPIEPPSTPWTHFHFRHNRGFEDYIDAMVVLISSPSVQAFESTHWTLTFALAQKADVSFDALNELATQIPCAPSPILRDFLARTPFIRALRITSLIRIGPDVGDHVIAREVARQLVAVPQSALPNLTTVQCPESFCKDLIRGRPVRSVDLMSQFLYANGDLFHYEPERFVLQAPDPDLSHSAVPVQHLAFGSLSFDNLVRGSYFADVLLESLTIYVGSRSLRFPQETLRSESELPAAANTTVKSIKLVVRGYGLDYDFDRVQCFLGEQARLCRWFSRAFTAAREISFYKDISWVLDPDVGEWKPDIAQSDRVKRALQEVKDKIPVGRHASQMHLHTIFPGQLHGDWQNLKGAYEYDGVTSAHPEPEPGEEENVMSHAELLRALQWAT
ncbi:unnamed protein product [Peniophora sp. CBMAI 1063]|nr:unnamed protein product [Peniophora sp. CBMAI 1063]